MTKSNFSSIKQAIEDIANGKMVIVVDDEDRENEGDLVMAAHFVTPDAINFMIKFGRGLVCVPVTEDVLNRFKLEDMVQENTESHETAFSVSFDASSKHGISTGISSFDRAKSIQVFLNSNSGFDRLRNNSIPAFGCCVYFNKHLSECSERLLFFVTSIICFLMYQRIKTFQLK